jgi:hypothetical protein
VVKNGISGKMPFLVIDIFKIVNIYDHEANRPSRFFDAVNLVLHELIEMVFHVQPGQFIDCG